MRIQITSNYAFRPLYRTLLAITPTLTTLEITVFSSDPRPGEKSKPITRDDIACILRTLPRLHTLILSETEIDDMSEFLDAYSDPACAHLRVLSITSGGTARFVPFLEALMDPTSVVANTLNELQLCYDYVSGQRSSEFLDALKRLLVSANPTLCLLRLRMDTTHRPAITHVQHEIGPLDGRAIPRPRIKAAQLSALLVVLPAIACDEVLDSVWAYANEGHRRRIVCSDWGGVCFMNYTWVYDPEVTVHTTRVEW